MLWLTSNYQTAKQVLHYIREDFDMMNLAGRISGYSLTASKTFLEECSLVRKQYFEVTAYI